MENNPVSLKSSVFGGFKKKDVLSYIFELNESTQDAQQKFAEQIEELSLSREALAKDNAEMESQIEELRLKLDSFTTRLADEQQKNAEASGTIDRLKAEVAKHERDCAAKDGELSRSFAANAELSEKNSRLEETREQVELAAAQIANLLSKAQRDADKITGDAQTEADRITDAAKERAAEITSEAKANAEKHISTANSELSEIYARFGEFCGEIEAFKQSTLTEYTRLNEQLDKIAEDSGKIKESVPQIPVTTEENAELSYVEENSAVPPKLEETGEPSSFAQDVLRRYGVRKDDSGFFRLAADK